MPSLRATIIAGLACLAGSAAAAAPGEIEVRLLRGLCSNFRGAFPTNTGNGYVGELELKPSDTGIIDDLPSRLTSMLTTSRGVNPWYTMAFQNDTAYAASYISCDDFDGLHIRGNPTRPIRINTDYGATLVTEGPGLMLEPYAHYIDGVRQPGVYLGLAGETRWAFDGTRRGPTTPAALGLWTPRLRIATDGNPQAVELKAGEVAGYLWAPQR
ncbi:hypothetical protein QBC39DRAFT_342325 [Podospora conica]|nr:hypothetical protein QBC39DRAFT_342325 [Schizothecium conicum]